MKFNSHNDLVKNMQNCVFYSQKLKKAYMTMCNKELKIDIYLSTEEGFNKKLHTLDATQEFHLVCLTGGFAPRLLGGRLMYAERKPIRQWHFGWTSGTTQLYKAVVMNGEEGKSELAAYSVRLGRDWQTDIGFAGTLWTGGFRKLSGVLEDGVGALSPTLAIIGGKLVNLTHVLGEVHGKNFKIYEDYYNSFLVRELKDLGALEITEIKNG